MSRTPAKITQADVARAIRATKQAGGGTVEVKPDGTIQIVIGPNIAVEDSDAALAKKTPVVL